MSYEERPKVIAALETWELFSGTYILGSKEMDRYIRVPAPALAAIVHAVSLFDGKNMLSDVNEEMIRGGWRLDSSLLSRQLSRAGLLEGVPYFSDLERVTVTWAEFSIAQWFPRSPYWRYAVRYLLGCAMAVILAAAVLYVSGHAPLDRNVVLSAWGTAIAVALGAGVSLVIHESAHALTAAAFNLAPRSMRLLGYWGVIPYAVLSIPGIYTLPAWQRIAIWLAGPMASLGLSCFCFVAGVIGGWPPAAQLWLSHMAVINLMVAIWNCCPLLPTDGYFIAATLLRQPNWRARSWSELVRTRHGRKPDLALRMYGVASLVALGLVFWRSCLRVLHLTSGVPVVGYLLLAVFLLAFARKRMSLRRVRQVEAREVEAC